MAQAASQGDAPGIAQHDEARPSDKRSSARFRSCPCRPQSPSRLRLGKIRRSGMSASNFTPPSQPQQNWWASISRRPGLRLSLPTLTISDKTQSHKAEKRHCPSGQLRNGESAGEPGIGRHQKLARIVGKARPVKRVGEVKRQKVSVAFSRREALRERGEIPRRNVSERQQSVALRGLAA